MYKSRMMFRGLLLCLVLIAAHPVASDAATFKVNNSGETDDIDPGDGFCRDEFGKCTLEAARDETNALPGEDTIEFEIPGPGVHTITTTTGIGFYDRVIINGLTQPGARPGELLIEIDGSQKTTPGATLGTGVDDCTIRGLIFVDSGLATGTDGSRTLFEYNHIGTDSTGTIARRNGTGILIRYGTGNIVRNNVISGNGVGVSLYGAAQTVVSGNLIGTDKSGTVAIPNDTGVSVAEYGGSHDNVVGAGNVISGNKVGVWIDGAGAQGMGHNVIEGNLIGTQADGLSPLGNVQQGIQIRFGAIYTEIIGNTIAFNGASGYYPGGIRMSTAWAMVTLNTIHSNYGPGIVVSEYPDNTIEMNVIYSNAGLGIDLGGDGVTQNDVGDTDTGPNELQNFPVLTSVGIGGGKTEIEGTLNSAPNAAFGLEFFANTECDPSGYGEGETSLGSTTVITDADGNASFTFVGSEHPGKLIITATATDPNGNTSEFSPCERELCGDGELDPGEICDDGLESGEAGVRDVADELDSCPNGPFTQALGVACHVTQRCGDSLAFLIDSSGRCSGKPGEPDACPEGPREECDNGDGWAMVDRTLVPATKTCRGDPTQFCTFDEDCEIAGPPCGNQDVPNACGTDCTLILDFDNDGVPDPYDACPTTAGLAERQGCPVGDANTVEVHVVDQAKIFCPGGAGSCKLPPQGVEVKVFDRNKLNGLMLEDGTVLTKNPNGSLYDDIFDSPTADREALAAPFGCVSDATGFCIAGEESIGDYLVIVKADFTSVIGKIVYVGEPKSPEDFVDTDGDSLGDLATKDFQILIVVKKNGFVQVGGGSKTVVTGSYLEMVSPDYAVWEDPAQGYVYPFIFTSDSEWTVDVCTRVPTGYEIVGVYDESGNLLADTRCVHTFVTGETKVVAFDVLEVGSPEPKLRARLEVRGPHGKRRALRLSVPGIRVAKQHASRGPFTNGVVRATSFPLALFFTLAFGGLYLGVNRARR